MAFICALSVGLNDVNDKDGNDGDVNALSAKRPRVHGLALITIFVAPQ